MARSPKDPKEIFPEITAHYKGAFGEDLISIILYGSAAGQDYRPGKSDINFMVVLSEKGVDRISDAFKIVTKWRKKNVAVPLLLTEEYLKDSLDTFPIEFLEMKTAYKVIHGEDLLAHVQFEKPDLRRQAERELKGKLLHLRQEFLESRGKVEHLTELVSSSLAAFTPVFRALLFISGEAQEIKRADLLKQVCTRFDLSIDLFHRLLRISRGEVKVPASDMNDLFDLYVEEMDKLAKIVDTMSL